MKFLIFLRPWGKHLKCKACFFHAFYACVMEKLFSREVQNSPDSDGRRVHKLPVKTVQLTCVVFLLFLINLMDDSEQNLSFLQISSKMCSPKCHLSSLRKGH